MDILLLLNNNLAIPSALNPKMLLIKNIGTKTYFNLKDAKK